MKMEILHKQYNYAKMVTKRKQQLLEKLMEVQAVEQDHLSFVTV